MRNIGHKRPPQFTEEDYISAIETAISNCNYPHYFVEISRISQAEEHDLGYDGVLTTLVPFFIQFKRSTFHTPQFQGKTAKDRASCGHTNRTGFFSFTLHRDKKSKSFDQHNALNALCQHAKGAYSAPLFYKSASLSNLKQFKGKFPWSRKKVFISDTNAPGFIISFRNVKVLQDSITFPPHAPVQDHVPSHEYTYTRNGDICFHSKPVPVGTHHTTFLQFIEDVAQKAFSQDNRRVDDGRRIFEVIPQLFGADWQSRNFIGTLKAYLVELDIIPSTWSGNLHNFVFEDMTGHDRLLLSETLLKNEFGIIQYTLRARID